MISLDKWKRLKRWMLELNILESDLQEKFIIGSGRGGQKLHKTASCVYLKHVPSGIEVKCQQDRSRQNNRYFARQRLCEKVEAIVLDKKSKQQQAIDKIRRQKKKRSRRAKQKVLDNKKHQSTLKKSRKKPTSDHHD